MDAMAFGMGCCCLQVTFQARDVSESRHLYDQLAVLSPILMALTAATPIARGVLLDTDARWDLIAASVDCRTPAERGDADTAATGATYDDRMAGGGAAAAQSRTPRSRAACRPQRAPRDQARRRRGRRRGAASNESDCGGCSDHAKTAAHDAQYNDIEAPYDEAAYASSSPAASTPRSRATSPTSSCATRSSSSAAASTSTTRRRPTTLRTCRAPTGRPCGGSRRRRSRRRTSAGAPSSEAWRCR